jgi:hypothetical protein
VSNVVTISGLPSGTTPLTGTEAVPVWQGGSTVQVPAGAFGGNNGAYQFVAPGSTDVQIQAAINALSATGGTVYLGAGTYTINNALVPVSGVSLIGVRQTYPSTTGIIGNAFTISGGTILVAGSATVAIASNTANLSTSGTWAAGGLPVGLLTGADFKNLAFSGFSSIAIQIGGQNNAGCGFCSFEWLFFKSCGTAMQIKNFALCNFQHLTATACTQGGIFQSAVAASVDQIGNSWFNDLNFDGQGANQNLNRPWIFGVDSAVSNANLNEIHATDIGYYNSGRSSVSQTATLNGTTTVAVTSGASFPVGMPVQFTSSADTTFVTGRSFFVLTQVGNNLTLGNYRGGSALTASGSTSPTIQQYGFPGLDLGGISPVAGAITASSFTGLDLEGPSCAVCYVEDGENVVVELHEVSQAANVIHVVLRQSLFVSIGGFAAPITLDMDGFNPGTNRLMGPAINSASGGNIGKNNGAAGLYYDYTNALWGLSLNPAGQQAPDLIHRGPQGGFLAPIVSIGQKISQYPYATSTLDPSVSGCFVGSNATAQTYTLPSLNNAFGSAGNGGLIFEVVAYGAGTITVAGPANKLFGSGANGKSNCVIPQGASAKFIADPADGIWVVMGAVGCSFT